MVAASDELLERLVADELRPRIREIVERVVPALVDEALTNGNGHTAPLVEQRHAADTSDAATKVCTICHEEKPLTAFEASRRQCRACRWKRERGRRDDQEGHPASTPSSSPSASAAASTAAPLAPPLSSPG